MDYIKLKKDNIYRVGIKDSEGNPKIDENGKEICIEFDLENVDTISNYNECVLKTKKAIEKFNNSKLIIEKKQDVKKKNEFISENQKKIVEITKTLYKDLEEAMDLFLGQGGTQKIFGNRRYIKMWDDFNEAMEPILPKIRINFEKISDSIKNKYDSNSEDEIL